ncbi:unnamed protein product, partial [Allacma fusca]
MLKIVLLLAEIITVYETGVHLDARAHKIT